MNLKRLHARVHDRVSDYVAWCCKTMVGAHSTDNRLLHVCKASELREKNMHDITCVPPACQKHTVFIEGKTRVKVFTRLHAHCRERCVRQDCMIKRQASWLDQPCMHTKWFPKTQSQQFTHDSQHISTLPPHLFSSAALWRAPMEGCQGEDVRSWHSFLRCYDLYLYCML